MSGSNIKDNKVVLKEDVLVFATGTKIITGVSDSQVADTIRDMTINPGDVIITREGNFNVMNEAGNISIPGSIQKNKYIFTYQDFAALSGASGFLPLFDLPAKAILKDVVLNVTTSFTNGGDTFDIAVGATNIIASNAPSFVHENPNNLVSMTVVTPVAADIVSSAGDLNTLTAGEIEIYIHYIILE